MDIAPLTNPTATVEIDFAHYLVSRRSERARHESAGGIMDYAFSLDSSIRERLASVGVLRTIAQGLTAAVVPFHRQMHLMSAIAVGPQQFPKIHEMGRDCAKRLGIGIPHIFVINHPSPNGWTYAVNDTEPIIILTHSLVAACDDQELKSVIGHECGHIQNEHGIYNQVWELLTNQVAFNMIQAAATAFPPLAMTLGLLQKVVRFSLGLLLMKWHRCAEITCDRAGLIATGDLEACLRVEGKLTTGGAQNLVGFNAAEYARQAARAHRSLLSLGELWHTHPMGATRVEAIKKFAHCDVLFDWRPEMRGTEPPRSKAEVDAECEALVQ